MTLGMTTSTNTSSSDVTTISTSNVSSQPNFTTTLSLLTAMNNFFTSNPVSTSDFDPSESTTWAPVNDTSSFTSAMEGPEDSSAFSPEMFALIHITAIASLGVSCLVSIGTLIYLFHNTKGTNFWDLKLCERLVVYLAINDFVYSISHLGDHSIILFTGDYPPNNLCKFFGLTLTVLSCFQAIVVCFSALSACVLIVANRKIGAGKYDWRLICTALGMPIIAGSICWALGLLGPGPAWCLFAYESVSVYINFGFSLFYTMVIISCTSLYISILCKMQRVSQRISKYNETPGMQGSTANRTLGAVKTMVAFVAVQMLQWIPYIGYSIWDVVSDPPAVMVLLLVFLSSLRGVFNCVAYTVVRKLSAPVKKPVTPLKTDDETPPTQDTGHSHVNTEPCVAQSSMVEKF